MSSSKFFLKGKFNKQIQTIIVNKKKRKMASIAHCIASEFHSIAPWKKCQCLPHIPPLIYRIAEQASKVEFTKIVKLVLFPYNIIYLQPGSYTTLVRFLLTQKLMIPKVCKITKKEKITQKCQCHL